VSERKVEKENPLTKSFVGSHVFHVVVHSLAAGTLPRGRKKFSHIHTSGRSVERNHLIGSAKFTILQYLLSLYSSPSIPPPPPPVFPPLMTGPADFAPPAPAPTPGLGNAIEILGFKFDVPDDKVEGC